MRRATSEPPAEYRDTDSLLTELGREFPNLPESTPPWRAISDIETAVRLLDDAVTTIIDTDLRREWEAERARLRAIVRGTSDGG